MSRFFNIAPLIILAVGCTGGKYLDDYDVSAPTDDATFYQPSQVTAGNASNFAPDLSPNGAFVVYTSDRGGDKDIWEKQTTGGYARYLTYHSADDFSGVISPDGDRIAFVSRREDAAGDIHVVELGLSLAQFTSGEGPIDTISSKQTEDSNPSWYPSSDKLVFSARLPGEKTPTLMVAELKDLKAQPLGEAKGDQPNVSPDGTRVAFVRGGGIYIYQEGDEKITQITDGGDLQDGQPRFTPDGKGLVFLRYADDTNGDGKLNGDDRATAWRLDLETQATQKQKENYRIMPLTAATFSTFSPQVRTPYLYVTLQTQEGLDIFRLPEFGQAHPPKDLDAMRKVFDLQSDYYNKTYVLRRAQTEFFATGDEVAAAEAALFELDWLVTNRRNAEAAWAFAKLKQNLPKRAGVIAMAGLAMVELEAKPFLYPEFQSDLNDEQKAKVGALIAKVDGLADTKAGSDEMQRRVTARSMIVRAKLMAASRQYFEASALLAKVVEVYPDLARESGEAAYYAAVITPAISDKESAVRALRGVVERYKDQRELILRASKDAVALNEGRTDLVESLVALRTDAKGLPLLPALAHMRISDQFMKDDKPAVAANELRQIVDSYPESPEIILEAAERLSKLEEQAGRYDAAEKMLLTLHERMKSGRPEFSRLAQNLLVNFFLRRGEAWQRENEYALAIKEYRKAIKIEPMNVGAHRGIIDATYMLKSLADIEDEYQQRASDNPDSAAALYFLGYLRTYDIDVQDSPRTRLAAIDEAIEVIEEARSLDADILQIHQTLGWLYLQKGYWRDVYYESGSVLAQMRRSYGLVEDFVGAGDPNWLELAIDSFQTAYFLSRPDSLDRVNLAQNLGQTYYELKNYQKSLSYYMQRIKQLETIPVRNGRAEGILWRRAARSAFQIEELELAESLQRNALATWERVSDDTEIAYSLDALALTLRERGKFKDAIEVYDRLRRLNERLDAKLNLVGTLSNMGYCAFMDGQYERALREFEFAEKTLAETGKDAEAEGETDAIQVNLAGQASAAKGFNVFARRNLIVTFRAKIYEQLQRPDLALAAQEEKLKLLVAERDRLIDDEDKPDAVLAEEIAIQHNLLGDAYLASGRHTQARASYLAASDSAKLMRPEDQTYMGAGEQVNDVNRARVELRLVRLGLMTPAEADTRAKELESAAAALRPVLEEGSKGQAKPMSQMLTVAASLRRVAGTPIEPKSYAGQLDESLALMRRGDIKTSNRDGVLLAFAQAPSGSAMSDESKGFFDPLKQAAAADPRLEWRLHVAEGRNDKAFEALDRFVLAGLPLASPTDRLAAREVMEALLAGAADDAARLLLLRRYLILRYTDMAQRSLGTVKDGKVELQRAVQKLLTLKELSAIGQAAGADAAVLTVHRTTTGVAHAYLQRGDRIVGATLAVGDADRLSAAAYTRLLDAAGLREAWPDAGGRLYIVPVGELFDVPWEAVAVGGEPLARRFTTAYVPVGDMIVELAGSRKLPKLSLGHVSAEPAAPTIAAANEARDYSQVIPNSDSGLAKRLAAFNLLHVDLPLYLNDVEPGESAIRGVEQQTAVGHQQDVTLRQLAALDLAETTGFVFSNLQRNNRDLAPSAEGRDGWVMLTLAVGAAGVPTALVAEGGTPDWQRFYLELNDKSFGEAARLAVVPGRVLGYAGIPAAEELAFAKEQLEEAVSEAEDADGDLEVAAVAYKRVLALQKRLGLEEDADETLITLVDTLYKKLDYAGALHFKKATLVKLKPTGEKGDKRDPLDYAMALNDAAVLATRALAFAEVESMLAEGEKIFAEEDEVAQLGKVYHYRGINLMNQKRYEETIEAYKKSREYYAKANPQQATARLLDIGTIYRNNLSNYTEAIEYYDQAAEEYKAQGNAETYLPVLIDKANTLMTIGQLEETIGILERTVIPALDPQTQRTTWVRATQILANAYYRAGMYQEAQTQNDRILVEVAKIESELSRVDRQLDARSLKGMILAKVGKYREAFKEFREAIDTAKKYNIKYQIALLYNNYGYWAREYGQVDQAIEFFNIALRLDEERKSRADIAFDLRNLGLAVILKGDYNRARDLLNEALNISQELRLVYNEAYCHFGLGDVAMREGSWQEASDHFRRALDVSRQGYMMDFVWRAHAGIAAAVLKLGDATAARTSYNESVTLIEKLRAGLKSEAGAEAFYSEVGVQEVYEAYADVLMQLKEPELAWQAGERARGRAFMDSIGTQKIRFAKEDSRKLVDEERELKASLEGIERRINQAADRQRAKKEAVVTPPKLAEALKAATARYAELIARMKQSDAQLEQFVKVDVVTLQELGELVPADTALLQYLVTPERLHIWVVRGGKLQSASVQIYQEDLAARVRDYRDLIQNYSTTDYLGDELYELLIAPVKDHLEGAARLAIVPHGVLHFVAFASLPVGDDYLVDRYPVYYLDAATMARFTPKERRLGQDAKILALAEPARANAGLAELPFTVRETEAMRRYFGNVDRRVGGEATESALRDAMASVDVLHVASHGEFLARAPAESRLLLAANSSNDGDLTVGEVFTMETRADMVTLSACESGMGRLSSADEVVGMNRAFFYAGTNTVVSSLWRINDVASAVVMKRFYRYLSEGDDKAEAMRKSQQVVRRYFAHPAYWSAFRVVGDHR